MRFVYAEEMKRILSRTSHFLLPCTLHRIFTVLISDEVVKASMLLSDSSRYLFIWINLAVVLQMCWAHLLSTIQMSWIDEVFVAIIARVWLNRVRFPSMVFLNVVFTSPSEAVAVIKMGLFESLEPSISTSSSLKLICCFDDLCVFICEFLSFTLCLLMSFYWFFNFEFFLKQSGSSW